MLSISTCWNSSRHTCGETMLRELVDLGFENVELGHGVRLSLMEGIQRFKKAGKVNISSLHNFCPLPVEVLHASPDCYQFTSHQEAERQRAIRLTRQTIEFAQRLDAPFVVLHLGTVALPKFTKQLSAMVREGKLYKREFTRLKLEAVKKREARAPLYLKRVRESLDELVEFAEKRNVHLGFESREAYEQIPNEQEMLDLLKSYDSPYVGYWHDIGHVQIRENLAFTDHAEWLAKVRHRMLGCHLHDVIWPTRDHQTPFTGEIDYQRLIPMMPKKCLFVFELSPRRKRDEIIKAREKWIDRFGA